MSNETCDPSTFQFWSCHVILRCVSPFGSSFAFVVSWSKAWERDVSVIKSSFSTIPQVDRWNSRHFGRIHVQVGNCFSKSRGCRASTPGHLREAAGRDFQRFGGPKCHWEMDSCWERWDSKHHSQVLYQLIFWPWTRWLLLSDLSRIIRYN